MHAKTLGDAGLQGWRNVVADKVAPPIARRAAISEDQVHSVIGGLFLILTVAYLARPLERIVTNR